MTATATPATPASTASTVLTRGPDARRKFQLTEFGDNHNKFWQIETWDIGAGRVRLRTTWGRVGSRPQSNEDDVTEAKVARLVREKEAKGYREVQLHVPHVVAAPSNGNAPVAVAPAHPRQVMELLDIIFKEAGERIASYLAVSVAALSQVQIGRGRDLLDESARRHRDWQASNSSKAAFAALVDSVKDYYNTIPTQLPRNLRDTAVMEKVVLDFCGDLSEQETRLDQLEAGLATHTVATPSGVSAPSLYDRLGARIALLPEKDEAYDKIMEFLGKTSRHGYNIRVRDIFSVEVPSERAAFEANTFGAHRILRLTHGTNNANVRHILREAGAGSGLRVPRSMTNGWMFGPGIYFANIASKSANYCRGQARHPRMMFLADVAVGDMFVAPDSMSNTREAPPGYHTVWGKAGHTGSWGGKLVFDEFIVYKQEQQSIKYLVTWEPC